MIQNFKTLVVLIILAMMAFAIFKEATKGHMQSSTLDVLKKSCYQITAFAFLSINFWMFSALAAVAIYRLKNKIKNSAAFFIFLLFLMPIAGVPIYGIGGINYFFILDFATLISLLIVYPAVLNINKQKKLLQKRNPTLLIEKFFLLFLILRIALDFSSLNVTAAFRGVFILVITVFLPFYLIANFAKSKEHLKEFIYAFIMVAIYLSFVGIFELVKHWPVYPLLNQSLSFYNGVDFIVSRDSMLRAVATTQQAIVLGYVLSVALGLFWAMKKFAFRQGLFNHLITFILVLGLISPLSRGPWLGAFLILIVYILFNKNSITNVTKIGFALFLTLSLITFTKYGEKLVNMLPVIGHTEAESFDYRTKLLTNSLKVVSRQPWFGSMDYLEQPEMEEMRQGQGIIDVTNTYLQVLLENGYVGFGLFLSIFLTTLFGLFRSIKSTMDEELKSIAQGLFATLIGTIFIIADVSSISFVPWVYWMLIALSVSTIKLINREAKVAVT